MDKDYEEMARIVRERKKAVEENNKLFSKNRLSDNIKKKIKTTMIGAIASMEEAFGDVWGIDKDYDDLDEDEKYYRDLWDKVRNEILNKGNKQIRICDEEIAEYTITWNKYRIEFRRG